MLVIQPTADGRLRIYNNHRSDFARDETSARTLAYNWGHTDISINKALSEMRTAARGEAQPTGWRVTRAAPAPKKAVPAKPPEQPAAEPASEQAPRVEMAAPVPERRARATKTVAPPAPAPTPAKVARVEKPAAPKPAPNTVTTPTKPVAPATKPPSKARAKAAPPPAPSSPPAPVKAAAKAPAKAAAKAPVKLAAEAPAKRTEKAAAKEAGPKQGAPAPREKALSLFRSGVKELAGMEDATLAFARGPWSELREMAEYITACLEGKRPKTGWGRK